MSLVADRAYLSGICLDRMPIRPNVRAAPAARLASEPRLGVRQPAVIRPPVAADRRRMTAVIVRAIDQETANATGAHFGHGDLHEISQQWFLERQNQFRAGVADIADLVVDAPDFQPCIGAGPE
jgi:hypothetical protein